MKKRNLKNLSLGKSSVSDLNTKGVLGGAGGSSKSFRLADCPAEPSARQTCQYSCTGGCYKL